jgi:multidrug resistance efflux pump
MPTADFERGISVRSVGEAEDEAAAARLASVERGSHAEQKLAAARVDAARARLESARASMAHREVRSPLDGTVVWSRRHPGEYYAPSEGPLLVIGRTDRLQVRLEFDDIDARSLKQGTSCELRDDGGAVLGEGVVERVAAEFGSRTIATERPTGRSDARIRETFVKVRPSDFIGPGLRLWGYCRREGISDGTKQEGRRL